MRFVSYPSNRPDLIYIGQEYPATIIEYNLTSSSIHRQFNIQHLFDDRPTGTKSKNAGLESLVYASLAVEDVFIVGRQFDAMLFIFRIPPITPVSTPNLHYFGSLRPPGPARDLSSLTIWNGYLWLLFDKDKQLLRWDIRAVESHFPFLKAGGEPLDASSATVSTLEFTTIGQEGIAFIDDPGSSAGGWVFVGVDPSKKYGPRKGLLRYPLQSFLSCFTRYTQTRQSGL